MQFGNTDFLHCVKLRAVCRFSAKQCGCIMAVEVYEEISNVSTLKNLNNDAMTVMTPHGKLTL